MKTIFRTSKRLLSGIVATAFAVTISVPAAAQAGGWNQSGGRSSSGGNRYGGERHYRDYSSHHRHGGYGGWRMRPYVDGAWLLGALGLGLAVEAIVASQRPVVVYQPLPGYRDQQAAAYPQQYQPDYPPPRRDYPECREFIGNPGAMAFCEKGVLERQNEERRLLEQRAYETGRGR